jgi:hypothetical protein
MIDFYSYFRVSDLPKDESININDLYIKKPSIKKPIKRGTMLNGEDLDKLLPDGSIVIDKHSGRYWERAPNGEWVSETGKDDMYWTYKEIPSNTYILHRFGYKDLPYTVCIHNYIPKYGDILTIEQLKKLPISSRIVNNNNLLYKCKDNYIEMSYYTAPYIDDENITHSFEYVHDTLHKQSPFILIEYGKPKEIKKETLINYDF